MPDSLRSVVGFITTSAGFVVVLFLKLCYSTALFATLAEITRRIELFRRSRRPTTRALLLLPMVVLFCSGILLVLNLYRIFVAGFGLNAAFLLGAFLRLFLLGLALVLGLALGLFLGSTVRMGRDRFGGVLYENAGRYLGLWLGAFALCGFFRLLPWGFLSFAAVLLLVAAAALVTGAHWILFGRYRTLMTSPLAEPETRGRVDLTLSANEAVGLALLAAAPEGLDVVRAQQALTRPEAALAVHPVWQAEAAALVADGAALRALLEGLVTKGLAERSGSGYRPAGGAARLAELGQVEEAVALTVHEPDRARTLICQRRGDLTLLVEPGPTTLRIAEQAPRTGIAEALSRGLGLPALTGR